MKNLKSLKDLKNLKYLKGLKGLKDLRRPVLHKQTIPEVSSAVRPYRPKRRLVNQPA